VRDDYSLINPSEAKLPLIKDIKGPYSYYSGPTSNIYKGYKYIFGRELLKSLNLEGTFFYKKITEELLVKGPSERLNPNEFATVAFKRIYGC
jgi:hypothetical protein